MQGLHSNSALFWAPGKAGVRQPILILSPFDWGPPRTLVSFLACFYTTSSNRMRWLWRKGGKFYFLRRTGVRQSWISSFRTFLLFSCASLSTLTMKLTLGVGRTCWMLFCTPFSSSRRPFFVMFLLWFVPQARKFRRLGYTSRRRPGFDERDVHAAFAHHASCHSRGVGLGVEIGSSLIKGNRMKFLHPLIEDAQTCFNGSQWVDRAMVEDWVEASSCSCERVFSYVTATDFGHNTERICETLLVRCNREAPEDWGPFEVVDEPRKTGSGSKGMWLRSKMVVCLGLLRSRICTFLWKRM